MATVCPWPSIALAAGATPAANMPRPAGAALPTAARRRSERLQSCAATSQRRSRGDAYRTGQVLALVVALAAAPPKQYGEEGLRVCGPQTSASRIHDWCSTRQRADDRRIATGRYLFSRTDAFTTEPPRQYGATRSGSGCMHRLASEVPPRRLEVCASVAQAPKGALGPKAYFSIGRAPGAAAGGAAHPSGWHGYDQRRMRGSAMSAIRQGLGSGLILAVEIVIDCAALLTFM